MHSLLPILLILSLCILQIASLHLSCRDQEILQYKYEAEVALFQQHDVNNVSKSQNIYTEATVYTHCVKMLDGDPNTVDDDVLLLWVKFEDIQRYAKVEDPDTGLIEIVYLNATELNHADLVDGQLIAQDVNGKIFKFIESSKPEPVDFASMKKAVFQMLQTSTDATCEDRELTVGTVDLCYKKAYLVEKQQYYMSTKASVKDIKMLPTTGESLSTKHDRWEYSHEAVIDRHGRIIISFEETEYAKGKAEHAMINPQVEQDLREGGDPTLGDMANGNSASSMQMTHILLRDDANATRLWDEIERDVQEVRHTLGSLSHLIDYVESNDDISFGELTLSTQHALELKARYKTQLEQSFNFWEKLAAFKAAGANSNTDMHYLRNYITVVGVDTHRLYEVCFDELLKTPVTERKPTDFHTACQSLLMSDHSDDAQNYLIHTMKRHRELLQHGFVQFLHLRKPIGAVVRFLISLQKYDTFEKEVEFKLDEPETFNPIKDQAYLVLAGLLKTIPRRRARHLLKIFLKHLKEARESKDHTRVLFVTHALHNAGHAAPFHELLFSAVDKDAHPEVQKASILALSTHTAPQTSDTISATLGLMALNHKIDADRRATAILAQLQREQRMSAKDHGILTKHLKLLYNNPHLSSEIHAAVEQYLHHDRSEEAARILADVQVERDNFDAEEYLRGVTESSTDLLIFGAVGKFFKDVGQAIVDTVVAVVEVIVDVVTAPFNDLKRQVEEFKDFFLGAVREPAEKCYYMTKYMHKMCVRDPGMADFVRTMQKLGQVESKASNGNNLVHEKYYGVNALHMYTGFIGGTYSAIECGSATVQVGFTEFARASIRLNYLDKHLDILTAFAYVIMTPPKNRYKVQTGTHYLDPKVKFDDTTPQSQFIYDHVYFRVLNWVLVDQNLVPDSFKAMLVGCERKFHPLIDKYWNPIFQFDFELSISFVSIRMHGGLEARLTVVLATNLCPPKLHASIGLEPTLHIAANIAGEACLLGACISARLELESQLQITPKVGLFGCKFCAVLESDTYPLRAKAFVKFSFLGMGGELQLLDQTWGRLPNPLFEMCKNLKFSHEVWWEDTLTPAAFAKSMTRLT